VAASNGASPTYGARQMSAVHHCKQHWLEARIRPFFHDKHTLHFGSLTNSRVLSSGTWPISDLFWNTRKNGYSCRYRFARDARQRRVDVARRQRGRRSIAHTVPPCGSANRRCVWFTDAAHLASIVCRQPPNEREKRRFVQKAICTGRATATRRRRQAASRLAFHCAHRIDMRFC
jgi:hypothetical protein